MSQNNLTYIPKLYFYGCSALEVIYLSRNKLSSMPNLEFVSDGIRIISLAVNRLVDVTALYRNQYPRLRGLVLNGNNLREFCLSLHVFTPLLKKVVLSENKLTTIQFPSKDFYNTDLKSVITHGTVTSSWVGFVSVPSLVFIWLAHEVLHWMCWLVRARPTWRECPHWMSVRHVTSTHGIILCITCSSWWLPVTSEIPSQSANNVVMLLFLMFAWTLYGANIGFCIVQTPWC